jgi:hypothetical protein
VVDAVIAARPDLVLLLGDYLDSTWLGRGRAGPEDVAGRLARLPNRVAVLGNHDWRAAGAAMWRALEAAGIPVLENAPARSLRDCGWPAPRSSAIARPTSAPRWPACRRTPRCCS